MRTIERTRSEYAEIYPKSRQGIHNLLVIYQVLDQESVSPGIPQTGTRNGTGFQWETT